MFLQSIHHFQFHCHIFYIYNILGLFVLPLYEQDLHIEHESYNYFCKQHGCQGREEEKLVEGGELEQEEGGELVLEEGRGGRGEEATKGDGH